MSTGNRIDVTGRPLYVTPTGVRLGSRGKVQSVSSALAPLPKSQRRRIRKALRAAGHYRHASM